MNWKEQDTKHLHSLLHQYLVARDKHERAHGQPNRVALKRDYQSLADELFGRMPDTYTFNGFVFKKAIIKTIGGERRTIQIYTEESYKKAQDYLQGKKNGEKSKP